MECCLENFDEEVLLEALLSPGKEILEASIAPTQLSPARQRQRLDHAGAGRPAPRSLQAELVHAEEAEPDARPDDMEPVLPSTQDGQEAEPDARPDDIVEDHEFRRVYNKFLTRYRRWVTSEVSELEGRALAKAQAAFRIQGKSLLEKKKLARAFWAQKGGDEDELNRIIEHWVEKENTSKQGFWIYQRSVFLTYNGSWGLLDTLPVPENFRAGSDEELACIVKLCQTSPDVVRAWKSYQDHWQVIAERDGWSEYAFSFEICPISLREHRVVRVHAHAALRRGSRLKVKSASTYTWLDSVPHVANVVGSGRCRQSGDNQAMYYLQCPKKGKVFSKGNIEPFHTYLVSGEWVMNLVQAGKMDPQVARQELVKTAKNLPRLLSNLDKYVME